VFSLRKRTAGNMFNEHSASSLLCLGAFASNGDRRSAPPHSFLANFSAVDCVR
jgi:hypothetical protein